MRKCKDCNDELITGQNWAQYDAAKKFHVCKPCKTIRNRVKNKTDKVVKRQTGTHFQCIHCGDKLTKDNTTEKALARSTYICNACVAVKTAKHRSKPGHYKARTWPYYLKKQYGLSIDEWEQMHNEQQGRCAICFELPEKKLCVDHCHDTGKVRQLLCSDCNTLLGMARENAGTLQNAIQYLEKHKGLTVCV